MEADEVLRILSGGGGELRLIRTIVNTGPFPTPNSKHWQAPIDRCELVVAERTVELEVKTVKAMIEDGQLQTHPGHWIPIDERTMELAIAVVPAPPK